MRKIRVMLGLLLLVAAAAAYADDARFDLDGPKIDVYVTRGKRTLPIGQVPNLLPHDRLRIKADLPGTQANHLLLIVAFLRDTTNVPPDEWFTRIDTWTQPAEGTLVEVPDGAQRAMLFIAPVTGGDFNTLRSAVKGNPGVFIRANAGLNKASFEQQRIERYLAGMQPVAQQDAAVIKQRSAALASALALKPNADCYVKPVEDQVDCLTQASDPLLLDDGHGQTVANAISTGASSDLITEMGTADSGNYSPYVGSIIDAIHLISLLRTAQYRYIPAITFPQGSTLNLKLNAPPSFVNPKSVIVVGLPAVQPAVFPPLRVPDPAPAVCLANTATILTLSGAPLVFSTGFAHNVTLTVDRPTGPVRIALMANAIAGGLVTSGPAGQRLSDASRAGHAAARPLHPGLLITGSVQGQWGFDEYDGPDLTVQQAPGKNWRVVDGNTLVSGETAHLRLQGEGTACIQQITLTNNKDKSEIVSFGGSDATASGVDLTIPMVGFSAGTYSLVIQQYGAIRPDRLALTAYAGGTHFDHVVNHPDDGMVALFGQGGANVVSVALGGHVYTPIALQSNDHNRLELHESGRSSTASATDAAAVTLKDGRVMTVPVVAAGEGSALQLVSYDATPNHAKDEIEVELDSKKDIALNSRLSFVVQSKGAFPRTQTIEVAVGDGTVQATLSINTDALILQDDHTAVGTLDLGKAFGASAFGVLRIRSVPGDGTFGSWIPLGTLVRRPHINAVRCSKVQEATCLIDGSRLFLALAFSAHADFSDPVSVPTGFNEPTFSMRVPARAATLYVRLRDDPHSLARIRLPGR